MNGAEALCRAEGEALRRALTVAFGDPVLARRATVAAFAAADRRWRAVATYPEPMAWVDATAVRHVHRTLVAADRRWLRAEAGGVEGLAPVARTAVVLHALRGRTVDDVAEALDRPRAGVLALLRDAYAELGVVDAGLEEVADPYAT
jgi:DNA-directed RNA polymerase specialized sigma24 family protein